MGISIKFTVIIAVIGAYLAILSSCTPVDRMTRNRQTAVQHRNVKIRNEINLEDEAIYQMDLMSWVHGHTVQVGNISETDLKAIVNSLKQVIRPEFRKYPRVKVYDYQFDSHGGANADTLGGETREVLVYTDPEEEKQWIVNIDDLDLRQNLIIFRLGDLGFGFSTENTFVVLRKTMSESATFHYFHLAYLIPRKKGKGKEYKDVEWDNIRPKDLLPIPVIYKEPKDVHLTHCKPRDCDLVEVIFGTCPIVRLSCDDLKNLPIYGRDKERMDALIREQQPFIYELARSVSINKKYLEGKYRPKRSGKSSTASQFLGDDVTSNHRSVKKDVASASNVKPTQKPQQPPPLASGKQSSKGGAQNATSKVAPPSNTSSTVASGGKRKANQENNVGAAAGNEAATTASYYGPTVKWPGENEGEGSHAKPTSEETEDKAKSDSKEDIPPAKNENGELPTSLDALQVDKDSDTPPSSSPPTTLPSPPPPEQESDSESYFEAILDKIRSSPPAKYTIRPRECVGCESLGTFFAEFEETGLVSYVANNIVHDIFRNTSSAVFSPEAQEVLEKNRRVPYIGYGSCPYYLRTISQSPKSMEFDDIIDYYTETMGANCEGRDCDSQRSKTRMRELLTSKYHFLEIWPDMTVRLNKSSVFPKSQILSTYEFKQFMVSLILSTYTTEYHLQILSKSDAELPSLSNNNQSIRMKFQTKLILRVVDEIIRNFSHHLVKGARYLLQILEDKYLSLVAEHVAIVNFDFKGNQDEKGYFKSVNRNDRLQALALKDFLMNGIASITKSGIGATSAFTTFYNHNHERIANLLVEFGVDRRRKSSGNGNHRRSAEDYETELLKAVWIGGDTPSEHKEQGFVSKVLVEFDDEGDI